MEGQVNKHKCYLNSCNLNQVNLDDCAELYESQKAEYAKLYSSLAKESKITF